MQCGMCEPRALAAEFETGEDGLRHFEREHAIWLDWCDVSGDLVCGSCWTIVSLRRDHGHPEFCRPRQEDTKAARAC